MEGMQWLQSTHANRFNRFRRERGPVFQGRYQAIVVEDGAHYIYLNPVRAGIVSLKQANDYRWSSLCFLAKRGVRPGWLRLEDVLLVAGSLADTPGGHAAYLDFLAWLHDDEPAQKAYAFDCMCKGWAMGSKEFKGALIEEHKQALAEKETGEADFAEVAAR